MKILAIRGKNLASLEDEFEIDFTTEPLKSAGIFAITGSTGSGKSTLLDALCLALFDDTPRTSRARESIAIPDVRDKTVNQKDCRTVLRRGMGEGYAEVDFISLGGEKFRSRWMVKRARGRADGALQNAEIRLVNLTSRVEQPGCKTDLLARIVELIGLTFEQFTRSVLLAQGDFATFLKARQTEKAELLEKLTGTEIYSRISMSIYEKSKQAEQEYVSMRARIAEIELLPEERLQALLTEKSALVSALKELQDRIGNIGDQIKWLSEETVIKNGIRQAEERVLAVQERIHAASSRYLALDQTEQAQEIRDVFNEWRQAGKAVADYQGLLKKQTSEADNMVRSLVQTAETVEKCSRELQEFNEKVAQIEPQLIRARELDVLIAGEERNLSEAQKEYRAALAIRKKVEQSLNLHREELHAARSSFLQINRWFEENRIYETLIPRAELVCHLIQDMQNTLSQLEFNMALWDKNRQVLEQEQRKLAERQAEAERLQRILPAEILALRSRLVEGQACPVCGSLHHPAAKGTSLQSLEEEELVKARERVAEQIADLSKTIEQRKSEISGLAALIENYRKHSGQMYEKAKNYLAVFPEWEALLKDKAWPRKLEKIAFQWSSFGNEQIRLKEQIGRLQELLDLDQKNAGESEKEVGERTARVELLSGGLELLRQERMVLLKGKTVEEAVEACTTKRKILEEKLNKTSEMYHTLSAKQEGCRAIVIQTKHKITELSGKQETLRNTIAQWLEKRPGFGGWESLTLLLSKDTQWLQNEKQFLYGLKEEETSLKAMLEERKRNLLQHRQASVKPPQDCADQALLQRQLIEKEEERQQKNARQAEIELLLINHRKGEEKIKAFQKELQEKEITSNHWKKLNDLFGSASGSKFKEIAQGYTLDVLLGYANKQLKNLSGRYELQRIPETLALQVVDLDMLGEKRAVHSLSGGESFLISLALALGLASLSSNRMNVESLFIDEGFGSLDTDTLRIALDALERLQTQGRKIGVISHITEMTERITVQIQVLKSANGKSEVRIVG